MAAVTCSRLVLSDLCFSKPKVVVFHQSLCFLIFSSVRPLTVVTFCSLAGLDRELNHFASPITTLAQATLDHLQSWLLALGRRRLKGITQWQFIRVAGGGTHV